jgi:iron complex outermembrane receptor protein
MYDSQFGNLLPLFCRKMLCKTALAFAAFIVLSAPVFGHDDHPPPPHESVSEQSSFDDEVVLPAAVVMAKKETTEHISQEQMNERGDNDLFEAMRWIPGVVQNNGHSGRNEGSFNLRGLVGGQHGASYVPVYIDDVPWINYYDGRIDYGAYLTGSLESIDIMKGYSSVLLGPNNLGGAVVMRAQKPKKQFEAYVKSTQDFDGGGYVGNLETVSVGTKQDYFYAKAGFQYRGIDRWKLPDSFEFYDDIPPEDGGSPQKNGDRLWSDSKDIAANVMFGCTPADLLDVWLTYNFSNRNKGFAMPPSGDSYVVWKWPYITRHTVSLHGEWTSDLFNVKALGYFDKYNDSLYVYPRFGGGIDNEARWKAYLDDTHVVSDYDDFTAGVNINGGYNINNKSKIEASFQFRQVNRKSYDSDASGADPEHDDEHKAGDNSENIWFTGLEYSINPLKPFTAVLGIGIDISDPQRIWSKDRDYKLSDPSAIPQWGAGLFYDLSDDHVIHITYAKKNRFPTFSQKNNSQESISSKNKANIDLEPVEMHHFEFGYKGYFMHNISVTGAVYYSLENNQIAQVKIDDPDFDTQYQNVDNTKYYGFEFGTEMYLNKYFTVGGALALSKNHIVHSESGLKYLGMSPELTTNGYFVIMPFADIDTKAVKNIRIIPMFEFIGSRYAASYTSAQTPKLLDSYALVHIKAAADITDYFSFSFGMNNLFDELYEILEFHPEAGRSFNITLEAKY